jgi:predicted nucleic acid-binding protein
MARRKDRTPVVLVKFLITNDHDLLDIPAEQKRKFKFEILTPAAFLRCIEPAS